MAFPTGEIYLYMLVLSTDRAEALAYKYKTLFEQSEKLVKIAAANFDKDGNVIESSSIVTTAKYNEMMSQYFDENGQLKNKAGLVTTAMANKLYAFDADGNIVSMIDQTAFDIRISASNISLEGLVTANSYFKILEDGSVEGNKGTFKNVVIDGSIRSPFVRETDSIKVTIGGKTEESTHDNVVPIADGGGWITVGTLEWDTAQSGRRMCLANYRWENQYTEGSIEYTAPSGKYFYEDGIAKESISLSRECVELMGYGTSETFYGWIVLNRVDLMTASRYGHQLKVLAMGIVTGSASGVSASYKCFDRSTLSVSRSDVGTYRVDVPSSWGLQPGKYLVLATGYGSGIMKATLLSTSATSFTVEVSDDASKNDGSFQFVIINLNDWMYI